eukprot:g44330.t1
MGPDNISAIVLRTYAPELAGSLAKLFQYNCNTGIDLTMRKIAQLCPVHKKQGESNPANYCPKSLLLIISQVVEGVKNTAIKQHPLNNNLLSDAQFRLCHSAPDLLTTMVQSWKKELNSRRE